MNAALIEHSVSALMVEDQAELREAIATSLSMFGIAVAGVGSAQEFRDRLAAERFDIVIVDIALPDGDGLTLVRTLTEDPTGPGIIILTAAGETEDRIRGFASGADLYFAKPVDIRELAVAAIRLAQRLRKIVPARVTPAAEGWTLSRARWAIESPGGDWVSLTPKEMRFLEALVVDPGAVVKRIDILARLGYADDAAGNRSLDALVRRLRIKAGELLANSLPIRTIHGIGYAFADSVTVE